MKWLRSDKGSTLMMVVITIAILGVLGTALLSMSLMNINMKYNDTRVKKTLYFAESGIDQVHARVGEFVENAIDDALTKTETDIQAELSNVDTLINTIVLPDTPDAHSRFITTNADGDYIVNTSELEDYADERFRYHFKYYMNRTYADDGVTFITNGIVNLDSNPGSSIFIDPSKITVEEFPNVNGTGEQFVFKNVTSTFIYKNNTEKVIVTDIVITDNIEAYPIYTKEKHIILPNNPIWKQSIVAHKDVTFESTAVNIDGNVFGYGTPPGPSESDSPKNYGGIIVSLGCDVDVDNANLISRNYVQLGENAYNSASLSVDNGMIYASSVVIQDRGDGVASGNMTIRGNVYTSDDLEINGDGGSVTIDGSYYGYTDGTDRTNAGYALTHDYSSAIIVNADIASVGFGLDIEPLKSAGVPIENTALDHTERTEGILVGGTAYVNITNSFRYQTAESVSLGGNFIAYTWAYTQDVIDLMKVSNDFAQAPYNFYSIAEHETRVQNKLFANNVDFRTENGITLANGIKPALITPSNVQWNLNDRKAYFAAFSDYIDTTNTFIKTGTSSSINLENYIYTTGLHLSDVSGNNEFVNNLNSHGDGELNYLRVSIRDDYRYLLNKLEHRGGGIASEKLDKIENIWDASAIPGAQEQTGEVNNINVINKYTKLDTGSYSVNDLSATPTLIAETNIGDTYVYPVSKDIVYIDSSIGNTLHIYPDGYAGSMEANRIQSSVMKGVIVTNSDIEIHGDLSFYGPIITGGEIKCTGGTQNFYNDFDVYEDLADYLIDLIYTNDELFKVFDVKDYAGSGTPNVNLTTIESTEVDSTQAYQPANNSAHNYHEYISFKHWKVEK